jgi:hypothetical protein
MGIGLEKTMSVPRASRNSFVLRRQDVEGVGDDRLRPLQLREELVQQVGQPGGCPTSSRVLSKILLQPGGEGFGVWFAASRADAPLVGEVPGVAAPVSRAFEVDDWRQTAPPCAGVSSIGSSAERSEYSPSIEALHEGAERQDVRRFPDGQIIFYLESIELQHQGLRQACWA